MVTTSPALLRVYEGVNQSQKLAKLASAASGPELQVILAEKAAVDNVTFLWAKEASLMERGLDAGRKFLGTPFGKGLGVAAGAAVPAVMAGNAISNHATEQARNRALETAGGVAAIGAGMYGLHRMMPGQKTASDDTAAQEAIEKLASVGYLDEVLSTLLQDSTGDQQKLAEELRQLNREFGVEVLANLVG